MTVYRSAADMVASLSIRIPSGEAGRKTADSGPLKIVQQVVWAFPWGLAFSSLLCVPAFLSGGVMQICPQMR